MIFIFSNNGVFADNTNSVEIQNIQVQPSTIKVGDSIRITATLVNNSTYPIFVSDMGSKDCQGPFFTIIFDDNVKVTEKEIACSYVALEERLDPDKKYTGTSPGLSFTYIATKAGTANVTVTFPYQIKNQTDPTQPNIEQTISKSFQFLIRDVNETYAQKPPAYFASPLQQIKAGVSPLNVKCSTNYALIIKTEDGSPACVQQNDTDNLMNNGWAINQFIVSEVYRNQGISVIQRDSGLLKYENGTFMLHMSIYVFINNFTQSSHPLKIQVLHDDAPYRTDVISSTDILPDGFYKYQSTLNHEIFGSYKVIATYENRTSQTSFVTMIPP